VIRSVLFTIIMFVTVPPYALGVILARPFGRAASYAVALAWVRLQLWFCRNLIGLDMAVEGQEHIPERNGVVFMKHSSAYETLAEFSVIPGDQTWVVKRELVWAPFFGWALACASPIAVNRSAGRSAVAQVVEQGKARLAEDLWIMIFPEGTRMAAGETRRYGISGTLLAQEAGVLITPVAHNAGYFWPRRGWNKRPGVVRFVVGPPVDPAGRDPREVNEEIQAWVEDKVAEISAGLEVPS